MVLAVPAAHGVHADRPPELAHVPAGHGYARSSPGQYFAAVHETHDPAFRKVPAGH